MQVQEHAVQTATLSNTGKYPVAYSCVITRDSLNKLLTIEPSEGTIAPGAKAAVTVTFNRDLKLKKEMKLAKASSLEVNVTEPLTQQRECRLPVKVWIKVLPCLGDIVALIASLHSHITSHRHVHRGTALSACAYYGTFLSFALLGCRSLCKPC